jgi:3-hydroxy-3-methylglutaryl CoA synthase
MSLAGQSSSEQAKPIGIKSCGAYVPRRRMSRSAIADAHAWALPHLKSLGRGEKSICSWDEDAITMAVEAARDCLRGRSTEVVKALTFASTSAPYADLQNAVLVGSALRLPQQLRACDLGGSTRAGLSALIQSCATREQGDRLVIASEKRNVKPGSLQEMQYGAAAGALLVGEGTDLIASFLGAESISVPFIDHFRKAGERFDYYWEERWVRDEGISKIVPGAVKVLLDRIGRKATDVRWFGLNGGPLGGDKLVAKSLGISPDSIVPDLQGQVGDTGAAHGVLSLIGAIENAKAGDLLVMASFAQGCDVIAFEVHRPATATPAGGLAGTIAQRIPESAYLKMLSFSGELELDWGMRAEADNKSALTQAYRSASQILGFVGGRCGKCGAVQFPRLPCCVNCGEHDSQAAYPMAEEPAKVATYTADWLQYSPAPPLYMGLVQFDVGARVLMEIVDVGTSGIEVGNSLSMVFRIKERDKLRQYDRYFWKATPRI